MFVCIQFAVWNAMTPAQRKVRPSDIFIYTYVH